MDETPNSHCGKRAHGTPWIPDLSQCGEEKYPKMNTVRDIQFLNCYFAYSATTVKHGAQSSYTLSL
jgi:hypothetical protein